MAEYPYKITPIKPVMIETDGGDGIRICGVIWHHKNDLIVIWERVAIWDISAFCVFTVKQLLKKQNLCSFFWFTHSYMIIEKENDGSSWLDQNITQDLKNVRQPEWKQSSKN